jgi:hypothetical protein
MKIFGKEILGALVLAELPVNKPKQTASGTTEILSI